MAASAARNGRQKASDLKNYKMAAATQVWKHTLLNIRVADGYIYPARSGTATDMFAGVASESKLSGAVAGADEVNVHKEGEFEFAASGMAQTDVGVAVYASDDNTVTKTSTNNQLVGYITEFISATRVRVRIDRAVQ